MGVVRLRRRWDPARREMVDVPVDSRQLPDAPAIWDDLPEYESPVTGKIVRGRAARREDLKRHRCRPWEGMEAEQKEAARRRAEQERQTDRLAEKIVHSAWAEMPPRIRKQLRGW